MSTFARLAVSLLLCLAACKMSNQGAPKIAAAVESDTDPRFGIAIRSSGHVCLSIDNANLSPGTFVKLVFAENPQSTADASVIAPAPSCPVGDAHSASYELGISRGQVEDDVEGIAVVGPAAFSVGDNHTIIGRLDPGAVEITFRSCESSEGVHLTVWSGVALEGLRLWHGYHHLDYGVEPNCTAKETGT